MMHPGLFEWLASGERGVSSNTIVTHLTGINALGAWPYPSHPLDPDDLRRCRLLFLAVPSLRAEFPRMAMCSNEWAALVRRWSDLCQLMDSEAPRWPRREWAACPKTYALMKELEESARGGRSA